MHVAAACRRLPASTAATECTGRRSGTSVAREHAAGMAPYAQPHPPASPPYKFKRNSAVLALAARITNGAGVAFTAHKFATAGR